MHRDQLRYFALTYETGSFALAGKRIPLSPQGVGRAVRALEQELGRPLFSEGTLEPTLYAEALYRFAKDFETRYQDLTVEFSAIDAAQEHVIRLGFSRGMLDVIGTDALSRFKELHPGVDFFFEEVVDEKCDENLVHGIYDLAFVVSPLPQQVSKVELFSVPMTLWVNVRDPLADQSVIEVKDLEGYAIATPAPGAKNVDRLLDRLEEEQVNPRQVVHLLQMHKIYDFVRAGKGVGTHIVGVIESDLFKTPEVKNALLEDFRFTLSIAWPQGSELNDEEKAFVQYVKELPVIKHIKRAAQAMARTAQEGEAQD